MSVMRVGKKCNALEKASPLHPMLTLLLSVRYEILTPNAIPRTFMDGKQACELMVSVGIKTISVVLLNIKLSLSMQVCLCLAQDFI